MAADRVTMPSAPRSRKMLQRLTATLVEASGTLHSVEGFSFQPTAKWAAVKAAMLDAMRARNGPLTATMNMRLQNAAFSVKDRVIGRMKRLRKACNKGPTVVAVHLPPAEPASLSLAVRCVPFVVIVPVLVHAVPCVLLLPPRRFAPTLDPNPGPRCGGQRTRGCGL